MMPPYGPQFGPDFIFLGAAGCDLDDEASYADADVVILGAPFDGGTSYRAVPTSSSARCGRTGSLDVVEVSPPYDHADITAALANRVVLETLCAIARKRQDLRDGARWDPL
jgi:arginase family enzyme